MLKWQKTVSVCQLSLLKFMYWKIASKTHTLMFWIFFFLKYAHLGIYAQCIKVSCSTSTAPCKDTVITRSMLKSRAVQALASFPQTACQPLVNKKTENNLCQLFILQVSCITKMTTNFSWTFCSFLINFQDIFKGCKTFY